MNIIKSALLAASIVFAPQLIANEIESLELSQGLEERLNRDIKAYLGNDSFILSVRAEVLSNPPSQDINGHSQQPAVSAAPGKAQPPAQSNNQGSSPSTPNNEDDFDLPALPSTAAEENTVDPAIAQAQAQIAKMEQTISEQAQQLENQAQQNSQPVSINNAEKKLRVLHLNY